MDQKKLTDQLQKMFSTHRAPDVSSRKVRESKEQLLSFIQQAEYERTHNLLIGSLKKYYKGSNDVRKSEVKQFVLQQIRQEDMQSVSDAFANTLLLFTRKGFALVFSFLLVLTTFLGPFQTLQPLRMVEMTQAAYLECSGKVYLNGELCSTEMLTQVDPGDAIRTDMNSLATLFYSDYTVIRLNDSTRASLDSTDRSQIHLVEGNVWLHSPGEAGQESFTVDTSVLRAKVPQGAAGVSTRGTTTQLYTTTAAVEVQIANAPGTTELMTLAPDKQLTIRKTTSKARMKESPLGDTAPEWVQDNRLKDKEYLQVVKQKTLENTIVGAGVLPGGFQDYLQKITQSARTVLTWDQHARLQRQLTELDELFAESLVLLEKGDITTAQSNFKAYQQKFASLLIQKSDMIRVEISAAETDSFGQLLRYHARLVSPYSPEDSQYLLKQAVEQVALQVTASGDNADARKIVSEAATNKLLLAHQSLEHGNADLAEEILLETSEFVAQVLPAVPLVIDTSDITILNTLASKSAQLSPLVRDIKRMKVEQLRSLTPQNQIPLVVGNYVAGTAYKPLESADSVDSSSSVKVVGQAVKEEEPL
jgi:hypothetical protein